MLTKTENIPIGMISKGFKAHSPTLQISNIRPSSTSSGKSYA